MRHTAIGLLFAGGLSLLNAGCGSSSAVTGAGGSSSGGNGVLPPGAVPQSRYDLANGCYALKSLSAKAYAVHGSDGGYTASATSLSGAEPFFMKPTALGKYLFYAHDKTMMAAENGAIASDTAPSDAADWTIDTAAPGVYTVSSAAAGKALAVDPASGKLLLADTAGQFGFDGTKGCTDYPEAQVNASGETFKGRGVDKPVLGFADSHLHISATTFLGGGHYGTPFNRFGITEALKNCEAVHGPDGTLDVVGNFLGGNPVGHHDTVGWPTFVDWPNANSLMHEATYYKWIERTYKAGLRLIVNDLVENQALCTLESKTPGHNPLQDCNEMDNAIGQVQFMHDLQDYIDAQEGGPGKGWFRLVDNPADARKVINDGKLAVVLGIEISHLFNCDVKQLAGGPEIDGCTKADIDTQIDRLYNLGVREMFPVHEFNNALGGNGIFDGLVLNAGNFVDTGSFWYTYDCPAGDYFYDPGAIMTTSDPTGTLNPLLKALLQAGGAGALPLYPNTRQCNGRFLTDLGRYALQKMMEKKIIIEIDHLELKIKDQLLDMAEAQSPQYPVVSTHGGHGGISMEQARRILAVGGILFPGNGNGAQYVKTLDKLLPVKSPKYLFGMGYGADTNGLAHQAPPRGANAVPVVYPFTLFKGAGWGPQFDGIQPVTFDREVSGERVFDINKEGWAHYGLVADFVDEVDIEGGQPALDALFNSAEAYLEMWERTVNR
ncbi:MAG TPA: hypothetical protein VFA75_06905 [Nevskia sp.]|nr:hypothetical protein [Nevskia sp.]